MHLLDGLGRVALARGEPEEALGLADEELARAGRHHAPKIEARAHELRGRALAALDRRAEARAALGAALGVAERIGYPPTQWRSLAVLAELARREGQRAAAEAAEGRSRALVDKLARTLPDTDLRRELVASAAPP